MLSSALQRPTPDDGRRGPVTRLLLVREAAPAYGQVGGAGTGAADSLDDDALEELGDEIAILAAHIHAATHRLLVLIARFDRARGWERDGHRSCAHWLAFRTGIDLGAAREKVRTARALQDLPATSASMARGELSFSQVRALTRAATGENEDYLLELAQGCTTAQLERIVRGWRKGSRQDEGARERERHERRRLSVFPDGEGMYVVKALVEPEVAAVLLRALEAGSDALFRRDRPASPHGEEESRRAAARRRADAIGLVAERALAAGFGGAEEGAGPEVPVSGTRAERFQVVLHVDAETLSEERAAAGAGTGTSASSPHGSGGPGPRSHLEDGTRVSAETSRRLSCDAGRVTVTHARDGSVLDVGRKTRTIPPALRRALEVRDRGCRFPGCGLRFTDAHHVKHWADGGETRLGNTLLVCRHHHRLLHEGGWRVMWWGPGRAVFVDPRGGEHYDGGWEPPAAGSASVEELVEENRRLGVEPDWRTAGARWKRVEDVPDRVWFRAMEGVA